MRQGYVHAFVAGLICLAALAPSQTLATSPTAPPPWRANLPLAWGIHPAAPIPGLGAAMCDPNEVFAVSRSPATHRHRRWPVALTFDDGPSRHTPDVLAALAAAGVHATFFLVGQAVAAYPATVKATLAAGHVVGVHTYTHPFMSRLSRSARHRQVASTVAAITAIAPNWTARWFRFPYGDATPAMEDAVRNMGLNIAWWSDDDEDWRPSSPDVLRRRILAQASPWGVVLMHDTHASTAAALPQVIFALRAEGACFMTLDDMLASSLAQGVPPRRAQYPRYRPPLLLPALLPSPNTRPQAYGP